MAGVGAWGRLPCDGSSEREANEGGYHPRWGLGPRGGSQGRGAPGRTLGKGSEEGGGAETVFRAFIYKERGVERVILSVRVFCRGFPFLLYFVRGYRSGS